jgi:predicted transcriptional regulator
MPQSVLEIAKDLTLALVGVGRLSAADMQDTLQKTYATLAALKAQEEMGLGAVKTQEPIDWRKSITRQAITCLECGATFKQLSLRHLRQHDLDGRLYRQKFGIPGIQPLAARATTARRRQIMLETKPWERAPAYIKGQAKKAAAAKKSGRKKATQMKGAKG